MRPKRRPSLSDGSYTRLMALLSPRRCIQWCSNAMQAASASVEIWVLAATLGCVLSTPCSAAPPAPVKTTIAHAAQRDGTYRLRSTKAQWSRRLDLRLPQPGDTAQFGPQLEGRSRDEPGRSMAGSPGNTAFGTAFGEDSLRSLEMEHNQAREMGRTEALARRFRREGLPIARLWENHSALVSLGLNAKGKPGLWLVQKTR